MNTQIMYDTDTIRDQDMLDHACRLISQETDTRIIATWNNPLLPEIPYSYSEPPVGPTLKLAVPDHLLGIPFDAFRQLVLNILDPDQPLDLYWEFIGSSAFRRSNVDRMEARLDLRPPRRGRDLRSSFQRVTRYMELDIPIPELRWSDRIPREYFSMKVLNLIVIHSDLNDATIPDLDKVMEKAIGTFISQEGSL